MTIHLSGAVALKGYAAVILCGYVYKAGKAGPGILRHFISKSVPKALINSFPSSDGKAS
jgi:hypothetical protein